MILHSHDTQIYIEIIYPTTKTKILNHQSKLHVCQTKMLNANIKSVDTAYQEMIYSCIHKNEI